VHGLILAGGEGSRLAADGVTTPKALVPVAGRPQLERLVAQFAALGCPSVTCLVRDDVAPLVDPAALGAAAGRVPVAVVPCRTPSSLHTLVAGLAAAPAGPVLASMVDTVMAPDDWRRVFDAARATLGGGADALLALTPDPGGDDAPLRVRVAGDRVTRVGGPAADYPERPVLITGGVYALAPSARVRAGALLAAGGERMRMFLAALVEAGADVRAATVPRILDMDHRRDMEAADAYAAGWRGTA
jgi:NDP-sugar pyrophosphorylase family protein